MWSNIFIYKQWNQHNIFLRLTVISRRSFFLEAEAIMVLLLFAGLFTTGGGLTVLHCLLPQILRSPFPSEGREALENIADDFKTENLRFSQLELV